MKKNPDTSKNAPDERVDELLNSYIDDELTAEQKSEVEGIISRDATIAQRLHQFQKCRMLVASMPVAEAPAGVLEGIKASLAGISLPSEKQPVDEEHARKKYVLVRKVLAAAAMIALAAVLSVVIHRLVPPGSTPTAPPILMATDSGFSGRLELKTNALNAVDAFIKSTIDDNGLSAAINPERRQARRIYSLDCSKEELSSLLADLDNVWPEFDSATLFVNTEDFGVQTVVNAVTTKQIAEIAGQDNPQRRIELAKDYAVLNNIAENLPDKEIRVAIEAGNSDLTEQWRMLNPILTGPKKSVKKPAQKVKDKQNVRLTIILDR